MQRSVLVKTLSLLVLWVSLVSPAMAQTGLRFGVVRARAGDLARIQVKTAGKLLTPVPDEHGPTLPGDSVQSNLILLPDGPVELPPAGIGRLILIETGPTPKVKPDVPPQGDARVSNTCQALAGVSQEQWRTGLAPPAAAPDSNVVRHLVVHHAATDNGLTDYTALVRAIYQLHRQVNGWDDIGYNYLIAPDGILYLGRDPQGRCRQDNVKGAHFCGKNTATMGVCMLGDFTTVEPTPAARATLAALLGWKLAEERFSAYSLTAHPPGSPAAQPLGGIVGHRDGCATECPGNAFYPLLNQVRYEADTVRTGCDVVAGTKPQHPPSFQTYQTETGTLQVRNAQPQQPIWLFTVDGRLYANVQTDSKGEAYFNSLPPGLFILCVSTYAPKKIAVW